MKRHKIIAKLIILFFCWRDIYAQVSQADNIFIDSLMAGMSIEEKVAQLFIIRSFSNDDTAHIQSVKKTLQKYAVGGVCFFKGHSKHIMNLQAEYQALSKIPLMMSMDAEWGAAMRLTDAVTYPKQLCLGAIDKSSLIYEMGLDMAGQLKRLGIHMNFAPVLDINNNPLNPVINERSFGDNPANVGAKAFAYMKGLQDGGVLACAKHFPGHGDTDVDSHYDLPILKHDRQRLDQIEMMPFKAIHDKGLAAIMVAHLHIPALDSVPNIPATLSHNIVQKELREKLGFEGLIITDALEMKGVTKHFSSGDIALMAFKAGNDMLLLSDDLPSAIMRLTQAIAQKEISLDDLHAKVRRILKAKLQLRLWNFSIPSFDVMQDVQDRRKTMALVDKLYRHALTIAKDKKNLVPIRKVPSNILSISLGEDRICTFQKRMLDYARCTHLSFSKNISFNKQQSERIDKAELVVLSIHKLNYSTAKNFGILQDDIDVLTKYLKNKNVILVLFGNPYLASRFKDFGSIVLAYENTNSMQDIAAQMLFGTDAISGNAPVKLDLAQHNNKSIKRPSLNRLGYTLPEAVGMHSDSLEEICRLSTEIIEKKASPGCQILVAKNGKIIFDRSYGHLTYDSSATVDPHTLYDVASLTKIVATAPALMLLEDRQVFEPRNKFKDFFPSFNNTNKDDLSFKDFLLHQGRLVPWIPFYKKTLLSPDTLNLINWNYYRRTLSDSFPIQVTDSLFGRFDITDTIFQSILDSRRFEEVKFRYSDIGYYYIPMLVSKLSGHSFETFLRKEVYDRLFMHNTVFNPLSNGYVKDQIAPTEIDDYFRHQPIHGYVHDMGAALMGGVSGHAGIFSTSEDLARIMHLYLTRGNYGGEEMISWGSMARYVDRDMKLNKRAFAFDMPVCDTIEPPYLSCLASPFTFGHQGFTGTCAWADPKEQLIYIFLSNRTYPNSSVNVLHRRRYRMKIHDLIYRSRIQS